METCEQLFSRPALPRGERPIRLGSLLFTLVEPRPGFEVAYNRWYERDHFYSGCLIGADTLAGNRYVATRDCKAKRFGAAHDLARGSYLALYWILDGHHRQWNEWAVAQVNELHAQGRMFKERDHIHTGLYRHAGDHNAPASTMPIELALDRAYAGLAAFILDLAPGRTLADIDAHLAVAGVPGDVTLLASPLPLADDRPGDVPASASDHVVIVAFSTDDPVAVWDERFRPFAEGLEAAGLGTVRFASPFLATVFGTDTYTDQL